MSDSEISAAASLEPPLLETSASCRLAAAYVAVQVVGALFGYLFRDVSASQSTHTRVR
ncbi:MAG: hypothetical protein V7675_04715 [Hyphomonas sp.]|uniref:hypothetical protein n=1 Tax=Hyphomonas sp. TaxID=87 RepID=UPI00300150A3